MRDVLISVAPRSKRDALPNLAPSFQPASSASSELRNKRVDAAGLIYFDLSDVAEHVLWHGTCAGIPRVQLEVATALVRANAGVFPFVLRDGAWFDIRPLIEATNGDVETVFQELKEAFDPSRRSTWRMIRRLDPRRRKFRVKRRSEVPALTAQDTLFIASAFWGNPAVVNLAESAAAANANLIVLIHDLVPVTNPCFTGHDFSQEYRRMLSLPAHFVVTTPFNRSELTSVRQAGIGPTSHCYSSIVPLAHEFSGAKRNERPFLASHRLVPFFDEDFVLCVGTVEVRKNHWRLLEVWEELEKELGFRLPRLVIAGRRGWKAEAALSKLDECTAARRRIHFVEAPCDSELRWLYSACLFTVLPSFFEGWGLPIGESFWFGKTAAVSDTSSMPTVGSALCLYFSPDDPDQMKAAIKALLGPETRKSLERKIAAAPLRTWSAVARDIQQVIQSRPPMSDRISPEAIRVASMKPPF